MSVQANQTMPVSRTTVLRYVGTGEWELRVPSTTRSYRLSEQQRDVLVHAEDVEELLSSQLFVRATSNTAG